jgi:tetratricopeptide (TPR) repeat protein
MTYDEDNQLRLRRQRSKQAIALAMQGRWREAIATNQEIIDDFPNDVEAYNRLGRAYMELGMYPQAKEAYSRSMELDPYNTISRKNLQRLSHLGEAEGISEEDTHAEPHHFIEEVGKTGLTELQRLGLPEILAKTTTGDKVNLKVNSTNLLVENSHGEYLGQFEPKLAQRLIKLMEGGNKYTAAIVSSEENHLTVIVREVYQDPSQAGTLSFPTKTFKSPRPYVTNKLFKDETEYEEMLPEDSLGFDEDQSTEQE